MTAATRPPAWAYASLAAAMILVGSYVGLAKLLVAVFPVFLLAWLRFGIAAVAMAGWLRRGAADAPLSGRERRLLFLDSLFGNVLFSVCMLFGVKLSSALAAGVIMAAIPAAVALLSRAVLGERLTRRVLAGVACAVTGIALVSLDRHGAQASSAPAGGQPLLGNLLLMGAVLCEASYVVIGKQLAGRVSARRVSALINLWGLALVTPLALWQAAGFAFHAVSADLWLLLVFYALAASVATVWLWMRGLVHVPAAQAGVFTVMLPVAAATVGVLFLGETVSALQAAAFALALLGVLLATLPGRAAAPD